MTSEVCQRVSTTFESHGLSLTADCGTCLISGNTFAHRERLRRAGASWDATRKAWHAASDAVLLALEAQLGSGPTAPGAGLSEAPGSSGWGSKHYHGHRGRLRQRFQEQTGAALADYELLELLLFFSVYRRDTKPVAKALLARFGSLGAVLAANPALFAEVDGLRPEGTDQDPGTLDDLRFTQVLLKAVHELVVRVVKEPIAARPVIGSWTALIEYLHTAMAHEPIEQFRLLFLDRKNILLRDEVQSRGTVDHTPLYPREVVKRALEVGASAIIMVHNHPSGDPTPSKADIDMTLQVIAALGSVDITVHDHVIVGKNRHLSFRSQNLI